MVEPYGHLAETFLWQVIYGFPARNLKIIGVTGTNGKTTTCFLIHRMMYEAGYSVGLMTTIGWGARNEIKLPAGRMTTMPPRQLLSGLKHMHNEGVQWVVMEVTSHALGQNRVWGVPFNLAVMTNITDDEHLDYHKTFERYKDAKIKLFKLAGKNNKGLQTGILNADDKSAELFAAAIHKPLTYGVKSGDVKAENVAYDPAFSQFKVIAASQPNLDLSVKINIPGSVNVYNALATASTGLVLGIPPEQIGRGIAALPGVKGRMSVVNEGQDFNLIIDYAHTPDAYKRMLPEIKPLVKGKLIMMFGSAGWSSVSKRKEIAKIAAGYADEIILTEEDDREFDGQKILHQLETAVQKAGKKKDRDYFVIPDRRKAIDFTVSRAGVGDTVLMLGKGHEPTIKRNHGEDPWDEEAFAREAIKKLMA